MNHKCTDSTAELHFLGEFVMADRCDAINVARDLLQARQSLRQLVLWIAATGEARHSGGYAVFRQSSRQVVAMQMGQSHEFLGSLHIHLLSIHAAMLAGVDDMITQMKGATRTPERIIILTTSRKALCLIRLLPRVELDGSPAHKQALLTVLRDIAQSSRTIAKLGGFLELQWAPLLRHTGFESACSAISQAHSRFLGHRGGTLNLCPPPQDSAVIEEAPRAVTTLMPGCITYEIPRTTAAESLQRSTSARDTAHSQTANDMYQRGPVQPLTRANLEAQNYSYELRDRWEHRTTARAFDTRMGRHRMRTMQRVEGREGVLERSGERQLC